MTYNVCGIDSKETEIANIFEKEQIDIAILTETHLTPGKATPPGWRHFSARTEQGRGASAGTLRSAPATIEEPTCASGAIGNIGKLEHQ